MINIEWYKIVGIILGLIVLYFIGKVFMRETVTNKHIRKATSFHKEAERYYEAGEYDLADEYNLKAEAARKTGLDELKEEQSQMVISQG